MTGNDLATAGSPSRYGFLGYGDWQCSWTPDLGFKAECLKHDVSYSTLRKIVDNRPSGLPEGKDYVLDVAWNPRNKYLADAKLYQDLLSKAESVSLSQRTACLTSLGSASILPTNLWAAMAYATCKTVFESDSIEVRANVMVWVLRHWPSEWAATPSIEREVASNPHFVEYP